MDNFERELVSLSGELKRYACSLTTQTDLDPDDLVQQALFKALRGRKGFTEGTSLRAWVFIIIRNEFITWARRQGYARMNSLDDDRFKFRTPIMRGDQEDCLYLQEVLKAMKALPEPMRVALEAVSIEGLSYQEAAEQLDVCVGTIKSRVGRARQRLACLLPEDIGFEVISVLPRNPVAKSKSHSSKQGIKNPAIQVNITA